MLAPFRSRGIFPYLLGFGGVAGATLLRLWLHPTLGEHLSFSFDFLAVFIAAWTGGIWPAAATALLSVLVSDYWFTPSMAINSVEEFFDLLFFVVVSTVIGILSELSLLATDRAQRAVREKDSFMAAVAHEMRSPLSVIYYANTLNRIDGSAQPNDRLDVIDRQVHHLNLMIEDLLDVSRIARGKIRLQRKQTDLTKVVSGAVERATPLIKAHRHKLNVQLPQPSLELCIDPQRIEQVLTNLLTNAAKYTPDGGEIVIRAEKTGDAAILSVRDNGIGITAEVMPGIFDMFVQIDGSRDRSEGGLGIGLALARKIAEMHGGTVTATSAGKGRGSEFCVSLPITQPAPQQAPLARV